MKAVSGHLSGEDGVIGKMIPVVLVLAWAIPAVVALWFFGIIALGLLLAVSLTARRMARRARPNRLTFPGS